jgi:hypothetical protein
MSSSNPERLPQILSVTNNRPIAKVRELVLASLGFAVQSRDRWTIRHASLHGFDLVLICHTVSDLEVQRIKERLSRCGSKSPILRVGPEVKPPAQYDGYKKTVPSWAVTAQFLMRWKPIEPSHLRCFTMPEFLFRSAAATPIAEYLDAIVSVVQAGH